MVHPGISLRGVDLCHPQRPAMKGDFMELAEAGARELVIAINRSEKFVRETREHIKKCHSLVRDIRSALVANGAAPSLNIGRFSRISDRWTIWEGDDMTNTLFYVTPSEIEEAIGLVFGDALPFDPVTGGIQVDGGVVFISDQKEVIEKLWVNQYK